MKLKLASEIANRFVGLLTPLCSKIEIAGSIRRKCPDVNDIDVVAIPQNPDLFQHHIGRLVRRDVLELATKKDGTTTNGELLKAFIFETAHVDLYITDTKNFAAIFLHRTGSKQHNIKLAMIAKDRGWKFSQYGLFDAKGKQIAGETEKSIFIALGLKYLEPEERN